MSEIIFLRRSITIAMGAAGLMRGTSAIAGTTSIQTAQVGAIEVTTISDGFLTVPSGFFPNALDASLLNLGGKVQLGANVWLIKSGSRTMLVDAGSGQAMGPDFPDVGNLGRLLKEADVQAEDITDVIVTHMHPDHIGGLIKGGQIAYQNAQIHIVEDEWNSWTNEGLLAQAPEQQRPIILGVQGAASIIAERVTFHKSGADLGDGISLMPAPGHTPGHTAVRVSSGDTQYLLIADAVVSGDIQFEHPDTAYALDANPDLAAQTRKHLFDMLSVDKIAFSATHLAFPGAGHVEKTASGYKFLSV